MNLMKTQTSFGIRAYDIKSRFNLNISGSHAYNDVGAQWLSGRVFDSRLRGCEAVGSSLIVITVL